MPKHGPSDGSRMATMARLPILRKASPRPTVVVDLPSPAGVGVIAVTSTSMPSAPARSRSIVSMRTLALDEPYSSRSSGPRPSVAATAVTGCSRASRAISMSVLNVTTPTLSRHDRRGTEPVPRAVAHRAHREHDGHLDEHADDGGERGAGLRS